VEISFAVILKGTLEREHRAIESILVVVGETHLANDVPAAKHYKGLERK
jgi:hypothetical protein